MTKIPYKERIWLAFLLKLFHGWHFSGKLLSNRGILNKDFPVRTFTVLLLISPTLIKPIQKVIPESGILIQLVWLQGSWNSYMYTQVLYFFPRLWTGRGENCIWVFKPSLISCSCLSLSLHAFYDWHSGRIIFSS